MPDFEKSLIVEQKRKSLVNAIRALSLFLLALILVIFAAVAWFDGSDVNPAITSNNFSVSCSDLTVEPNSDDIGAPILNGRIYLPSATKLNDGTISNEDLSKAITYRSYKVTSSRAGSVRVEVTKNTDSELLHYMLDNEKTGWVSKIKAQTAVDVNTKTFEFVDNDGVYEAIVYVVMYGDYDDLGKPKSEFVSGTQGSRDTSYGGLSFNFSYVSPSNP